MSQLCQKCRQPLEELVGICPNCTLLPTAPTAAPAACTKRECGCRKQTDPAPKPEAPAK